MRVLSLLLALALCPAASALPASSTLTDVTDIDCRGHWSACPSCSDGPNTPPRSFVVTSLPKGNGNPCPTHAPTCTQPLGGCNYHVNCDGYWSACTAACEKADERKFEILRQPQGTGKVCPSYPSTDCDHGEGECRMHINCEGHWSNCSRACEKRANRTWVSITEQRGNGVACPSTPPDCQNLEDDCVMDVNCDGFFANCSHICETAEQRTWTSTAVRTGNGAACPSSVDCKPGDGDCRAPLGNVESKDSEKGSKDSEKGSDKGSWVLEKGSAGSVPAGGFSSTSAKDKKCTRDNSQDNKPCKGGGIMTPP